jgi:hypothetical protein
MFCFKSGFTIVMLLVAATSTRGADGTQNQDLHRGEKILREITGWLTPGETMLSDLVPEYWKEAPAKLRWNEALVYTGERYEREGSDRGLFLWKYLYPEQPAKEINELNPRAIRFLSMGEHYQELEIILVDKKPVAPAVPDGIRTPVVSIYTYIQGRDTIIDSGTKTKHFDLETSIITGPTRLALTRPKIKSTRFEELLFNSMGQLHRFSVKKPLYSQTGTRGNLWIKGWAKRRSAAIFYSVSVTDGRGNVLGTVRYDRDLNKIEPENQPETP